MCNSKCCGGHCVLAMITKILVIIGGINWGLVGIGMLMSKDLNLVKMLLGSWPTVEAAIYLLVGISAVFTIFGCRCKKCTSGTCGGGEEKMAAPMPGAQM